jgi:hypothetical protein
LWRKSVVMASWIPTPIPDRCRIVITAAGGILGGSKWPSGTKFQSYPLRSEQDQNSGLTSMRDTCQEDWILLGGITSVEMALLEDTSPRPVLTARKSNGNKGSGRCHLSLFLLWIAQTVPPWGSS